VKVVSEKTTLRASNAGLRKSIKKSDVLSIEEQHAMLSQMVCQPTSPYGHNIRFGYFFINNFFIRGCFELQNAGFEEFALVQLPTGLVLKFC